MNMNPQAMMQMLSALNTFKSNHPKFAGFIGMLVKSGIPEDSIIEITVKKPGEEPMTTNMKVLRSDLELLSSLKNMNN